MADVVLDFTYDHSIEEVWEGITNSSLLEEWIMPNNFKAEPGYAFEFKGQANEYWDGIIRGEVLEVEAPHKLSYCWNSAGEMTTITWTLVAESAAKTNLHFEMDGFSDEIKQYPGALKGAVSSWSAFAHKLKEVLAKK